MTQAPFPQWLLDNAVSDDAFEAAYDGLSGERRAWVKKTAAQLFEMAGAGARAARTVRTRWTQGFVSERSEQGVDCSLLLLDSGCLSAARAAAAALPVVASGAPAAALCLDGPVAPDVLAALELCGLETVVVLDHDGFARLVEHLLSQGLSAAVPALGGTTACEEAAALAFAAGLRVWTPWSFPVPGRAASASPDLAVWAGDQASWDFDALAWAHAGHLVAVWNAPRRLPRGLRARKGDFEAFLGGGYRALLVPDARLDQAMGAADLVLGPGQEGCWAWPDLTMGLFLRGRLGLRDQA